jgi:uncharacterized protein (DUF2141 family)
MFNNPRMDFILALTVSLSATLAFAPHTVRAAPVEVSVLGVPAAKGHVRVQLCTRDTFLRRVCPYRGEATASVGATVVRFDGVAPGRYAVQAFHDETDQGVVHQNLLGIPRERIGFSNDASLGLRGPRFEDAAFPVGTETARVNLTLRRVFGVGA